MNEAPHEAARQSTSRTMKARATWLGAGVATTATAPAPAALVLDDLALICGGMFAVDHLGPEAFESVRARVLAQTPTCLEAIGVLS